MKSKIVIKAKLKPDISYPLLKEYGPRGEDGSSRNHLIVLFFAVNNGICVYNKKAPSEVGIYYDDWGEESFTIFNGSIELSNGEV